MLYSVHVLTRLNFLITVTLSAGKMLVFIFILFPIQNGYSLKQYYQKSMIKYLWAESFIRIHFLFRLLKLHLQLPQILTQVENIFSLIKVTEGFNTKFYPSFGVWYRKIRVVGMKWWSLKSKEDHSFWSSSKRRTDFLSFRTV